MYQSESGIEQVSTWRSPHYQLHSINFLKQKIKQLEKAIIQKVKLNKAFKYLLTVPGSGNHQFLLFLSLALILMGAW